ncbi:Transmembrane protein 127-like [Homarus americanus]|uniref:Transmembrane protein 127-like n=1 Tax=Homarus americanus TaxID=6706 RepID=A0A8J5JP66_HOMAM|nr:Transmembrane protein 127-like [Homarus americanus]
MKRSLTSEESGEEEDKEESRIFPAKDLKDAFFCWSKLSKLAEDYHPDVGSVQKAIKLKFCVTPEIVALMRIVIGLIFAMICSSLVQMLLDITGPTGRIMKCFRKNAVAGIFSVLVCVLCVGVCYYIIMLIETQQEATKPVVGPTAVARVQVKLDVGFYLLIFAGGLSVIAVGCSWLRPAHLFQDSDSAPLMEDWGGLEGLETFSVPPGSSLSAHIPYLSDLEPPPPVEGHPPPPYTP